MERIDDMTEETKQKIQKIAQNYGYDAQSRQCIEEMAELTQAINKFWRKQLKYGKADLSDVELATQEELNLLEEMADVQIMLWQLEHLLIADLNPIIQQKLDRQMERIEKE